MNGKQLLELTPTPVDVARVKGQPRYVSAEPCGAGHVGEHYTATGRCVTCAEQRNAAYKPRRKALAGHE